MIRRHVAQELLARFGIGRDGGQRLVEFVGQQGRQLVGGLQALQAGGFFQRFPRPVLGTALFA